MKHTLPLLAVLAFSLTACTDPLKTTEEMNKTTKIMSSTTNTMSDHVVNTDANSADLGITMKKGQSAQFRDEFFNGMLETEDFTAKTDYATEFMYALEFQIWKDAGIEEVDSQELLEHAKAEAVLEVVKKMSQFLNKKKRKVGAITGLEKTEDMENFFAMAGTMHKLNPLQIQNRKNSNVPVETFMDIVYDGLLKKVDLLQQRISVEDLTRSQKEVLKEEQFYTNVLDARYKFIPLIMLSRMSYIKDGLAEELKMVLGKWHPVFAHPKKPIHLNAAQLDYLSVFADEAMKAKKVLIELKVDTKIHPLILRIFKNMDMSVSDSGPVILTAEEKEKLNTLQAKIQQLLAM